jgi:hypothetical protein
MVRCRVRDARSCTGRDLIEPEPLLYRYASPIETIRPGLLGLRRRGGVHRQGVIGCAGLSKFQLSYLPT